MHRRRMIALEQLPLDERDHCKNCFYCIDPKQPGKKVGAVAAVEVEMPPYHEQNMFWGICSNHAEVSNLSFHEWQEAMKFGSK